MKIYSSRKSSHATTLGSIPFGSAFMLPEMPMYISGILRKVWKITSYQPVVFLLTNIFDQLHADTGEFKSRKTNITRQRLLVVNLQTGTVVGLNRDTVVDVVDAEIVVDYG